MSNPIKSSGSGGKVVSFPGSQLQSSDNTVRRTLVPIGPSLFTPPFDVISELTNSREKYQIHNREHQLTLYAMPQPIVISLELLRGRAKAPFPGFNAALVCCGVNGISILQENADIQELIQLRSQFTLLDQPDAQYFEEVRNWFIAFDITLPESKRSKTNAILPEWLKGAVSGLSAGLGVSSWSLLLLATMVTLITQNKIIDEHRGIMKTCVNNFYKKVEFRRRIAGAMLEIISDKPNNPNNSEHEYYE